MKWHRYLHYGDKAIIWHIASTQEASDGTEMMLAIEYGKKHNMSIKILHMDESLNPWGQIYSNWTGFGTIGYLVEDKGDIGFGK